MNKGTLTDKEIADLKASMPGIALFKWPVPLTKDEYIIFRAIDRKIRDRVVEQIREAETLGKITPIEDVNERLFDACVVWPSYTIEDKMSLPVGIIGSIIKAIQEKSGYLDVDIFNRILAPDTHTSMISDFNYWDDISDDEKQAISKNNKFQLHRIRIGKWIFVVRPMTRIDLQIAQSANDAELTACKAVTVWPEKIEWDNIPGGYIDKLSSAVNRISGWNDDNDMAITEL